MAKAPFLVMGTAGHVDHGKTTLVKALTGVDLDTLPEEKARGLTINLGFTSFETPSGNRVGIVDVPGHRRFVKTMLAGAHGLDFVLFLVAADDSVMPQTREHLAILELLGVERGIVALTKIDLVDEELRDMVVDEVQELVAGTFLEEAPLVKVSSVTDEGLPELVSAIDELANDIKPRDKGEYFRMFVDRSFTMAGAGTVVTGTALSGSISPGEELEVLPGWGRARVRKIEVHGEPVERARAGQRTAINLRLVEKSKVSRGDLLVAPGRINPTYMIDARFEVLPEYPRPITHWARARFYVGTHEAFGRVVLLDVERIPPGSTSYVQIRLESPVPAMAGDPFILRDFSSSWTMGGGLILDAHPVKHKRKRALVVSDLEKREKGYLEEVVELETKKAGYFVERSRIAIDLDAPVDRLGAAASSLAEADKIIILPPKKSPWFIHHQAWERLVSRIMETLREHHESLPQLETGLSEQELRDRVARLSGTELDEEPFGQALEKLVDDKVLQRVEATYAFSGHAASLGEDDQAALSRIRAAYSEHPLTPPVTEELYKDSGLPRKVVRDFLDKLLNERVLVRVSREFLFDAGAVEDARVKAMDHLKKHGAMTVAQFRDITGTTRKYAVPLLNFFDQQGYTIREGDFRRTGPRGNGTD